MAKFLDVLDPGGDRTRAATRAPLVPLRPAPLEDAALREEIELLLDVMASVAECRDHLTSEQVDAALRLRDEASSPHRIDPGATLQASEPVLASTETWRSAMVGEPQDGAVPGAMGELFDPEPEHWGLRGISYPRHVWASMLSRLEAERVPPTPEAVERVLADAFRAVVGVDLSPEPLPEASKRVYRLLVTEGEMLSGVVDVEDWKHRLIPLLLSRVGRTAPRPAPSGTASCQRRQHRAEQVGARRLMT